MMECDSGAGGQRRDCRAPVSRDSFGRACERVSASAGEGGEK